MLGGIFRGRRSPLAIAVAGPVLGMAVFLGVAIPGARAAGVNPLYSYYTLKSLDSLLLGISPLLAALVGIGMPVRPQGGDLPVQLDADAPAHAYHHRFAVERTLTINTAAAGGNASLMTIG